MTSSPLLKLEGEEVTVADPSTAIASATYSSLPTPLTEDRSQSLASIAQATKNNEVLSLRNQLELSTYEYAALEERYRALKNQHSDLRKLGHTFNDVIYGSSSYDDEAVSIERLRAEAGHEGLRAKALIADMIRPVFRGAGGLQSMIAQAQSISLMVEEAGGVDQLRALVAETYMLRFRVKDIGGLAGIDRLISQVNSLQSSHRELVELKAQIDEPDGLRTQAQKYGELQQALVGIEAGRPSNSTPTGRLDAYTPTPGAKTSDTSTDTIQTGLIDAMGMNPARASLLAGLQVRDSDRGPHNFESPFTKPSEKASSSNEPLVALRGGERSQDHTSTMPVKRQHDSEEPGMKVPKRPRVDIGRASAVVQATLTPSRTSAAPSASHPNPTPITLAGRPRIHNEKRMDIIKTEEPGFRQVSEQFTPAVDNMGYVPVRERRASSGNLRQPLQLCDQPVIKQQGRGEVRYADRAFDYTQNTSLARRGGAAVFIADLPIALWIGLSTFRGYESADLIKSEDVPTDLGNYLAGKMGKHLTARHIIMLKNNMPANPGTCVLRHLVDDQRPSNIAQFHRSCGICTSRGRPCALLQKIDGFRTVVFLPSRDAGYKGLSWRKKEFWVQRADDLTIWSFEGRQDAQSRAAM